MHNLFFNLLMIIPTLQKNTVTELIISNLTKLKDGQILYKITIII